MNHSGSHWQTKLSSVRERNFHAFNNSLFCDVELSVKDTNGDKVTVKAHKYVLAISSPVFEAMFYGELAETGRTIDLPDCTEEGLQELLHYVYSDEVNLSGCNVLHLLYLAYKYMMPFLVKKCEEYLEEHLGPDDVFDVLPQAQCFQNKKLEDLCWRVIDNESQRAVSSELFLDVSRETLYKIVERESLKIEEIELFKSVEQWAEKRVKENGGDGNVGEAKRAVLGGDLVRLIRFPVMTEKDFIEFVLESDVLDKLEVKEILKSFHSIETQAKTFKSSERKGNWKTQWSNVRFQGLSDVEWYYESKGYNPNCIDFQVDKPVSILGVRLFGSINSEYQVKLKIATSRDHKSLFQTGEEYLTFPTENDKIDGFYWGFSVLFEDPIPLLNGIRYTIEADIKGPASESGCKGMNAISCGEVKIEFYDPPKYTYTTTVESGQFPALLMKFD